MKYFFLLLLIFLMVGCSSIKHQTTLSEPLGEVRIAGVGDVVLKATSEKSLPNVFGKADIFGRTAPTEITKVIFEGVQEGKVYFSRQSVDIETGATTMNSSPIVVSNHSTTIVLPPTTPEPKYLAGKNHFIELDLNSLPAVFLASGTTVKVISADGAKVKYILEKVK